MVTFCLLLPSHRDRLFIPHTHIHCQLSSFFYFIQLPLVTNFFWLHLLPHILWNNDIKVLLFDYELYSGVCFPPQVLLSLSFSFIGTPVLWTLCTALSHTPKHEALVQFSNFFFRANYSHRFQILVC